MVESSVLLEAAWPHLQGLLVGVVGLSLLLSLVLLVACCVGSSNPPSGVEEGANRREVPKSKVSESRTSNHPAHEKSTVEYFNEKIDVGLKSGDRPEHSYMNASAAGTQLQPVKFNVDKVIKSLKKKLRPYIMDSKRLELHGVIGKGAFGLVYKGIYQAQGKPSKPVAAKTVHGDECNPDDMRSFLEEVVRMFGFNHVNIQSTIGICFIDKQPYAVMPFMDCGDLRSFLLRPEKNFTLGTLIKYTFQIANGMEYLSARKFVHRDLAARNCMINGDCVIKVADFGLSRDIFDSDYYRMKPTAATKMPARWMAVESLHSLIFTTKTDVWSFGIVMWEIITRGHTPYSRRSSRSAINFVKGGGRLEKPDQCPSPLFKIMAACWKTSPGQRPSFSRLVAQIQGILGDNRAGQPSSTS